jgi:hypothetical protein
MAKEIQLNATVRDLGFENEEDFFKHVSSVLINTPKRLAAFDLWKLYDGTKTGLLRLEREESLKCS